MRNKENRKCVKNLFYPEGVNGALECFAMGNVPHETEKRNANP